MTARIRRAVVRLTDDHDPCFGKPLMVKLEPRFIRIWQKGHRRQFNVTYADIWRLGFMAQVRALKAEKKKGRRR